MLILSNKKSKMTAWEERQCCRWWKPSTRKLKLWQRPSKKRTQLLKNREVKSRLFAKRTLISDPKLLSSKTRKSYEPILKTLDQVEDNLLKLLIMTSNLSVVIEITEMIFNSWLSQCNYSSKKPAKESEIWWCKLWWTQWWGQMEL